MRPILLALSLLALHSCADATVILPLGDSITVGQWGSGFTPGAYRSRLESLAPSVSFVGPKSDNAAPGQISPYHAGWSGVTASWFPTHLGSWGSYAPQADTVILMAGTNDVNTGLGSAQSLANIESAARAVLLLNPAARLFVCTVAPQRNGAHAAEIAEVNLGIADLVNTLRCAGSRVELAPTHFAYEPVADRMIDNLHPNAAGYDAMAIILEEAMHEITGDVDGDGEVSIFDYVRLSDAFDSVPGDSNWHAAADLDQDQVVSIFDYVALSENFSATKWH